MIEPRFPGLFVCVRRAYFGQQVSAGRNGPIVPSFIRCLRRRSSFLELDAARPQSAIHFVVPGTIMLGPHWASAGACKK
jgi:hypothetical protein